MAATVSPVLKGLSIKYLVKKVLFSSLPPVLSRTSTIMFLTPFTAMLLILFLKMALVFH
jgi:hypothetical protein